LAHHSGEIVVTAFKKFDAYAFLKREQRRVLVGASATDETESPQALAPLATLAAPSVETEIRSIGFPPVIHGWSKRGENQIETAIPAKIAKVAKVQPAVSDPHPYRLIFDALERRCPDFVPNDRWKRAIEDAQSFLAIWGTQADALGWTERELFGLHPVLEQPTANYSRLSRLDETGLIWLLRGRPVIVLTATEAAYRCPDGAILKFYKRDELAPGLISEKKIM
jgi:hypothetical protein